MVVRIADSVLTPLGLGTKVNYHNLKEGQTGLKRYDRLWNLPDPFVASFLDESIISHYAEGLSIQNGYTRVEKMAIIAISDAIKGVDIDLSQDDVLFVLATAKGNVHLLENNSITSEEVELPRIAKKIARWFGNYREPIVVSNACISGVQAQIEAWRILYAHFAQYVVVVAADMLSPFVVSGFQSFKALSTALCRPFDEDRMGLNLGEAAACAVYRRKPIQDVFWGEWAIAAGAVFNDSYHISHPSKTAEGSSLALLAVLCDSTPNQISMINVHGTATMFNDEMESVALERTGLSNIPINSLKGYFGHTMGASGLLETLITMASLDDGIVLGTKGFSSLGVSKMVNISSMNRPACPKSFIKLASGFGGCNAAIRYVNVKYEQDSLCSHFS